MVNVHPKEQKKSRKPNKHPNNNRDAPEGHHLGRARVRESTGPPHQPRGAGRRLGVFNGFTSPVTSQDPRLAAGCPPRMGITYSARTRPMD